MRRITCIAIAAIGLAMLGTGPAAAQEAAKKATQEKCKSGQVYNGRTCVSRSAKRTDRAAAANPEPATGYGFYRRNPGNPCGDPHLTIQEGACRAR
jgi:hypothetical protein